MLRTLGVFIGGGIAALGLATLLHPGPPTGAGAETRSPVSAPGPNRQPFDGAITAVRDELALEREGRVALGQEVARLREQVQALVEARSAESPQPFSTRPEPRSAARPDRTPGFDEETLVEAGFSASDVDAFRSSLDEIELERLYLRDRAEREGWLGTPRYAQENRALTEQMFATREEFGDDLYDWVLYSSGHSNRVRVVEVMEGSAAADAGFAPGDTIVRYGAQRILSAAELRESTSAGDAGETMPVDVVRSGEERRLYVPRGPLGVRIEPASQEPPSAR